MIDLNEYDKIRYSTAKDYALQKLGGKCIKCGSTDRLEFDHINPKTKVYNITTILKCPDLLEVELEKCQLLCRPCHITKTVQQHTYPKGDIHGTGTASKYCGPPKCEECRRYYNNYMKRYMRKYKK